MSISSHLHCCCPRAQLEQHPTFSRLHIICNRQPSTQSSPSPSPSPSIKSPRLITHLLSAAKSAPPVVTPHIETDGHDADDGDGHGEGDDDDDDNAAPTQLYRGHLEELVGANSGSPASASAWWESLLPFLSNARVRSILLLNLLTFLYGSNIPIIKEAEAITNPSLFLCGRFALATVVLTPFITRGIKDAEVRNASLELGFWISLGYWTQSVSLLTTDAGRASFISAFTVIAVPLLAGLSGREISKLTWVSAIASFVGVGLLETSGSPASVGDLWSLVSAVLFGVHMLRTEHYSRSISSRKTLPMLGVQLLVVTLSCILWSLMGNTLLKGSSLPNLQDCDLKAIWESISHMPWLLVVYTGTVSTTLCLWIEMTAMRDISATDTAVIYSLEPLWGAAFAWWFLEERWGPKGWFGALLILGGSLAVQLTQAKKEADSDVSKQV